MNLICQTCNEPLNDKKHEIEETEIITIDRAILKGSIIRNRQTRNVCYSSHHPELEMEINDSTTKKESDQLLELEIITYLLNKINVCRNCNHKDLCLTNQEITNLKHLLQLIPMIKTEIIITECKDFEHESVGVIY